MELYLKSVLGLVEHNIDLETSHDIINIYRCLSKRYKATEDLTYALVRCRKYFNEARYPTSESEVYTKQFCEEFLGYIDLIRNYVDNQCHATTDDLIKKFK